MLLLNSFGVGEEWHILNTKKKINLSDGKCENITIGNKKNVNGSFCPKTFDLNMPSGYIWSELKILCKRKGITRRAYTKIRCKCNGRVTLSRTYICNDQSKWVVNVISPFK